MKLFYISGGQRSGKSRFAQECAMQESKNPVYLATARIWDDEFGERVQRHKSDRGDAWQTIEIEKKLSSFPVDDFDDEPVIVLDCITLWLTNFFTDNDGDPEKTLKQAKMEWDAFSRLPVKVYAVSNEIGMGIIPDSKSTRAFTDVQGFINQFISANAFKRWLMVSGFPLEIK